MTTMFSNEDWTKFRSLETLPQKAGVSRHKLGLLVAKELADNALDHSGHCEVGYLEPNGFYVKDNGEGIPVELLPELFSINRPFMSSKQYRLPTRGALGNGLRVATGAVISTGGSLQVSTRGKMYRINFQSDGTSTIDEMGDYDEQGTRIEIQFGSELRVDLDWAEAAIHYSRGEQYKGKTSGHWYTSDAFYEICQGSNNTVNKLISEFDGCTGTKAGKLASNHKNQLANTLSFEESEVLLGTIREASKQVNADRLGSIGEIKNYGYYKMNGSFKVRSGRGIHNAEIPFAVEAWVDFNAPAGLNFLINKSPMTGQMTLYRGKKDLTISGCGLFESIKMKQAHIVINIITPYMPIVSDGKEPDLNQMKDAIVQAVQKAVNRANKFTSKSDKKQSQKQIILDNLQAAIDKSSGNGRYPFSLRQVYYAIRPYVITELDRQLEYNYFCGVITDYEAMHGEISNMYRDNRGILYHPHTGQEIPIGTLTVRGYQRPVWTFNKILYCEKEGLFPLLKAVKFPERYDCALVTSKGYASRAVKDLLDMLGESEEELQFFCIHDADAAGTKIYETLVEETKARPGRKVTVTNLGLDPEEAVGMGLEVEELEKKKDEKPVAAYVPEKWKYWLQTNRVELNAMDSELFVSWLERKMEPYHTGKLVPDANTLKQKMESTIQSRLESEIRERILREARYHEQVQEQMQSLLPTLHKRYVTLANEILTVLEDQRELHWANVVEGIGNEVQL